LKRSALAPCIGRLDQGAWNENTATGARASPAGLAILESAPSLSGALYMQRLPGNAECQETQSDNVTGKTRCAIVRKETNDQMLRAEVRERAASAEGWCSFRSPDSGANQKNSGARCAASEVVCGVWDEQRAGTD